jgi:hypothetical protein
MTPTNLAAAVAVTLAVTLAAAAPAAAAGAADFPTLKNGQWEMTTRFGAAGNPPRTATICLDATTQKAMLDMSAGMQKEMCTRMDMRRDGPKFITDAECKLGESVVKSHGVMTMIGDSAYHTETSATFDPPLNKDMRESKTVIDGKYTGACRDGLQPGDMVTGNGQKINLNQIPPRPPAPK